MQVFTDIVSLKAFLASYRTNNQSIGLVPTMGALHLGHLTLVAKSLEKTDLTVCTIFVNPTQFNNASDLSNYPRTPENDLRLLQDAGCQVVFMPDKSELYASETVTSFNFGPLENVMEGPNRPGHFSGVALIVSKLFNIIQPTIAFFGQKDWQQCCVINQLVTDLLFPLQLEFVPTERNTNGLALSSRNSRLSESGVKLASQLYQALLVAASQLKIGVSPTQAEQSAMEFLSKYPEIEIEYLQIANSTSLQPLPPDNNIADAVICIAAWLEGIRLIDNLLIKNYKI